MCYLCSPNVGLTLPILTTYMPVGQMPIGRAQTLNQDNKENARAGLPVFVLSTMSGPPPETTQDRKQTRTHTSPRIEIKIPDPPGIKPGPLDWKAETLPSKPRRRNLFVYIIYNYLSD